jgi:hypothetical protein
MTLDHANNPNMPIGVSEYGAGGALTRCSGWTSEGCNSRVPRQSKTRHVAIGARRKRRRSCDLRDYRQPVTEVRQLQLPIRIFPYVLPRIALH